MNDVISPDGSNGGASPPLPSIDYEPVGIEVDSVASFGKALRLQADNVGTTGGDIKRRFGAETTGALNEETTLPVGGGLQDLTITQIATEHSSRMSDMSTFITNVQTSLGNLGKITAQICAEYSTQDALNGADVERVKEIIAGEQPGSGSQEV